MDSTTWLEAQSQLAEGMGLTKCRECGCMQSTLDNLQMALAAFDEGTLGELVTQIKAWQGQMNPIRYACLGCSHCYPAVAGNALNEAFPQSLELDTPGCAFDVSPEIWPPVAGEYVTLCHGQDCPVAVSTLGSVELVDELASRRPSSLCIVGKTETENIGLDKVIRNCVSNPAIRYLILAGVDPAGHYPGATLLALSHNGVDANRRVLGSPGKRPTLHNVTQEEIRAFQQQVAVIDMIGCEDLDLIVQRLQALGQTPSDTSCGCSSCGCETAPVSIACGLQVEAQPPEHTELDRAGYFVILLDRDRRRILAEHYSYDNILLRVVEGHDARSIYWTVIEHGWVSQLSHAAYLGKELTRAELSLERGLKFVQDGA